MNRKGLAQETLVRIILFIVVLFLLGSGMMIFQHTAQQQTIQQSCKLSVALSSLGENSPKQILNPFDLYCPRSVIFVQDKKIEWRTVRILRSSLRKVVDKVPFLDGGVEYEYFVRNPADWQELPKRKTTVSTDPVEMPQELGQLVAYEMAECWETFLKGTQDTLPSASFAQSAVTCFVCSEISFDNGDFEPVVLDVKKTLQESPHHFLTEETITSYEDYLYTSVPPSNSLACREAITSRTGFDGQGESPDSPVLSSEMRIEPYDSLLVVFYRVGSKSETFAEAVFDKKSTSCQGVTTIKTADFASVCDLLIN